MITLKLLSFLIIACSLAIFCGVGSASGFVLPKGNSIKRANYGAGWDW